MRQLLMSVLDYFVPPEMKSDQATLMKTRMFVLLHLIGPAMGHSVILFLWRASPTITWHFWLIEANVVFFWTIPLFIKYMRSLVWPALLSVEALVFLSLFGSFFYGGISSPFMPWFLIALLLGFFYLAEQRLLMLSGVAIQLGSFVGIRLRAGDFGHFLPLSSMRLVTLISIVAAMVYTTILCLYYETVMRDSALLEEAARQHRNQMTLLNDAVRRAELASKQKSIFLAKISHELRTPLNAVIGYSELLRDQLDGDNQNKQRAIDLGRINAAGRHLLDLVTNVLDLRSIEAQRLELSVGNISLPELIQDVIATAAPLVAKKHNQLVLQMAGDIRSVETDALKLRQVILNLLSNAAKFTSHGTITLNLTEEMTANRRTLVIKVLDTGIGMNEEIQGRLFKDFSQGEPGITQKFGGTGLGLALTRRLCALMGGTISVVSQPNMGSAFTIEIPAVAPGPGLVPETNSNSSGLLASFSSP